MEEGFIEQDQFSVLYSFDFLWNVDENSFVLLWICLIFCSESEWVWHLISLLTILNYICWLMYEYNELRVENETSLAGSAHCCVWVWSSLNGCEWCELVNLQIAFVPHHHNRAWHTLESVGKEKSSFPKLKPRIN